jgi:hypothetical protein
MSEVQVIAPQAQLFEAQRQAAAQAGPSLQM